MNLFEFLMITSSLVIITHGEPYGFTVIDNSPGLYYERMDDVSFTVGEWTIATAVNLTLLTTEPYTEDYALMCKEWLKPVTRKERENINFLLITADTEEQCRLTLGLHVIEALQRKLHILKYNLHDYILNLQQLDQPKPVNLARTKRTIPLAIAEGIAASLFGFLTERAARRIFDHFTNTQLTKTEPKAMEQKPLHLVENSMTHQSKTPWMGAMEVIKNSESAIKLQNFSVEIYIQQMKLLAEKIRDELSMTITTYQDQLEVLQELHEGRVSQKLLGPDVLEKIIGDIRKNSKDFKLPEYLTNSVQARQLCPADGTIVEDHLIITMHLPLMEKTDFELYELHTANVPQKQLGKMIMAGIKPQSPYLARSYDHKNYLFLDEKSLRACQHIKDQYYCSSKKLIFDYSKKSPCEITILNEDMIDPSTCDVQLQFYPFTQWTQLRYRQEWLYSTTNPEYIKIQCEGKVINQTRLREQGTVRLDPGCKLLASTLTIHGESRIIPFKWKPINFKAELNLVKSQPWIKDWADELVKIVTNHHRNHAYPNPEGITLKDSIRQLELDRVDSEQYLYTQICLGTILLIFLLSLLINLYLWRSRAQREPKTTAVTQTSASISLNTPAPRRKSVENAPTNSQLVESKQVDSLQLKGTSVPKERGVTMQADLA